MFEQEPAIKALDAVFWSKTISMTNILEVMPAKDRNEWNEQLRTHSTPEYEPATVRETMTALLSQREKFFAQKVDGIFRALSGSHVTNQPQGFSKRMIISRAISCYGTTNHDVTNYIHDLRCVIAKFMGRDEPLSNLTYKEIDRMNHRTKFGVWHSFDGGAFRVKLFKVGTAHMEVHPDMAWRLNQVLAWLHPMAIPPASRAKPAKPRKDYPLQQNLLSFKVIHELQKGRFNRDTKSLSFFLDGLKIDQETSLVLQYLGGVPGGAFDWKFDYEVSDALNEITRTGTVPEAKSHQFYPTKEKLAALAVDLAEIGDTDQVVEPSAGLGALAAFLPPDRTTCIEISPLHCKVLEGKGFATICADFLSWAPAQKVDRICMNPPYGDGRGREHVKHAVSILRESGRLVAILPAGLRNKTLVEGWSHTWSEVYSDEFDGTGVSVALLTLKK
ncbi:DUF4942 domain-containing protein [Undibacterium arcticum]|uniref:DUF4942 domain-containing protein n=1 Tax=Undibacterium arcticum TaxID=1762892 RepID=A0ABV7F6C0_9BURK